MKMSSIAILMATYNGAEYLSAQIGSILSQTCQDWHLYVHDDGSTDATLQVLNAYREKHPDKITIFDYAVTGGALRNFMSLLERVDAPYYMFCDQDDVWLPNKIQLSIEAMHQQELIHPDKPIIVHSDVTVVDKDLNVLHPSYREYGHIYPHLVENFDQCVINVTLGCAMLFNAASRRVSLDCPWTKALMHDGWVTARTYAASGVVYAIPESLMLYRNHGNNTIGAYDGSRFTLIYRIKNLIPMLRLNMQQYNMLRSAGYGSILKYYYYKLKIHIH